MTLSHIPQVRPDLAASEPGPPLHAFAFQQASSRKGYAPSGIGDSDQANSGLLCCCRSRSSRLDVFFGSFSETAWASRIAGVEASTPSSLYRSRITPRSVSFSCTASVFSARPARASGPTLRWYACTRASRSARPSPNAMKVSLRRARKLRGGRRILTVLESNGKGYQILCLGNGARISQ